MSGLSISEYDPKDNTAKAACLALAQIFGETMMANDVVIVGGLVPSLLFADREVDPLFGPHVGTHDVDVVLSLMVLDDERYKTINELLTESGFVNDVSNEGKIIRQRWILERHKVEIDFLMPLDPSDHSGAGKPQHLTKNFAAIKMLGLDLAIEHKQMLTVTGRDLDGVTLTRSIPVCRAEVLVLLKAIALIERNKPKDSYDLCFVLRNMDGGPLAAATWLKGLPPHGAIERMERSLRENFKTIDDVGPRRLAQFMGNNDEELRAQGLATVFEFLRQFAL